MSGTENRQIVLVEKPKGALTEAHFRSQIGEVPVPGEGQILVRTILLSLDAANRAWMDGATYRQQVMPGDVMHGYGIGEVVTSKSEPALIPMIELNIEFGLASTKSMFRSGAPSTTFMV